ncbi:hypothetical protein [Azospirillum argentinense]|uniref:hypothetical protein n=1 Tax=Azospirillum argentinense TaxID=2970906 RepID=UPI0032DED367
MLPHPHALRRSAAVLLLAAAGGLAGCADPRADVALAAQSALVGMPKGTLLSCAGVPHRQAASGPLEFFAYRTRSVDYYAPPPPPVGYGWGYPWGYPGWRHRGLDYDPWDYYPPSAGNVVDNRCEATFTLRNGAVERLVYRTSSLGACAAVVQNCMALVPQSLPPRPTPPHPTPPGPTPSG